LLEGQAKLVFEILDPSDKPFKSTIQIKINNYTIFASSSTGIIKINLPVEKAKIKLTCMGVHDIVTDSLNMQSKTAYIFKIKLESIALKLPTIVYSYDKPVIYFYPENEMAVDAQLNFNGNLSFTYPKINADNGWNFIARKNGDILMGENTYKYLFWEGKSSFPIENITNLHEGFIVRSDTLVNFLESSLKQLSLNNQEIQDFITYWVPKMMTNEINYVKFLSDDEYNSIADLKVFPIPDCMNRVFMLYGKAAANLTITKQILPHKSRTGFTVIEWGGTELVDENIIWRLSKL